MFDLEQLHLMLRAGHIAVGFTGLALFWMPLIARKGSRLHVVSGVMFVWCAYIVGGSGTLASVWGIAHPASYLPSARTEGMTADEARVVIENLRFLLSITGFLGLAIVSGAMLGRRVMRCGEAHERLRSPLLVGLLAATIVWSAGLAVYGCGSLITGYAGWHFVSGAAVHRYWVCAALGVFGVVGTMADLRYVYGPKQVEAARWVMHVNCMIGVGAGFYAAFFFFASRLLGLPGLLPLLGLIAPLVAGAIAIKWWTRRLGELLPDEREIGNRPPLMQPGELARGDSRA